MNSILLSNEAPAEKSTRFDYDCQEEQSLISLLA